MKTVSPERLAQLLAATYSIGWPPRYEPVVANQMIAERKRAKNIDATRNKTGWDRSPVALAGSSDYQPPSWLKKSA